MEQLKAAFREAGVIVPFTSNEKGMRSQSWSTDYQNVGGAVDIYGLDSYPGGLSCTNPNSGFTLVRTYYQCEFSLLSASVTAGQHQGADLQTQGFKITALRSQVSCQSSWEVTSRLGVVALSMIR